MSGMVLSPEHRVRSFIVQYDENGRPGTIRAYNATLGRVIRLDSEVVRKPAGNKPVPEGAITGRVVDIDPIDANTRLWAEVVHVWWKGQGFPEKFSVNQIVPAGWSPKDGGDKDPKEKTEKAMAAGAAIAIGGSSGQISVANQESD